MGLITSIVSGSLGGAAALHMTGTLNLVNDDTGPGELRFLEDTDNGVLYTGFKSGNVTENSVYTMPVAYPASNKVLQSTDAGVLTWETAGSSAVTAINNATANELVTIGATTTELDAEANLTYDGTDLTATSATSAKPVFTLQNTNDDATGPTLKFNVNTSDSAAVDDVLGNIDFAGEDADENATTYARISGSVGDHTSGGEEGRIGFAVAEYDGTLTEGLVITGLASDGNITVDVTTHDGAAGGLMLAGTLVTSTAAELNILDGVTSDAGELNLLDGSAAATAYSSAYNSKAVIYSSSGDIVVGQHLILDSDTCILSFGANDDVKFTHYHDNGLLLNATRKIYFEDGTNWDQYIGSGGSGITAVAAPTEIDLTAPTVDINASTAVTIDGPSVVVASSSTNEPVVEIKNAHNGGTSAELKFNNTEAGGAGAAGDDLGRITFYGQDAGSNNQQFGEILCETAVVTAGQEGGKLSLKVAENDGTVTAGLILQDGDADGEVDVTIGAGAASLTTISGDLDIPNGGFALGSDADGDIYYRNSGNLQRLAKGDDDEVLTLASGLPSWAAAGGGGGTDRFTISNRFRAGAFGSTSNVYFTDDVDTSGNQFYVSKAVTHGATIAVDSDWLSGFEGGCQWQAPRACTLTQITATSRINANASCHTVRVSVWKATPANANPYATDITWTQIGTADLSEDGSSTLTDYDLLTINTAISSGNSISAADCIIIGFQPVGGTTAATSYFQVTCEFTVS